MKDDDEPSISQYGEVYYLLQELYLNNDSFQRYFHLSVTQSDCPASVREEENEKYE